MPRSKLPEDQKRVPAFFMCSPLEKLALERNAGGRGKALSAWIRNTCLGHETPRSGTRPELDLAMLAEIKTAVGAIRTRLATIGKEHLESAVIAAAIDEAAWLMEDWNKTMKKAIGRKPRKK